MSTGSSRSASARRDLVLPESLRGELKIPLGLVLTGEALVLAVSPYVVVAVGDYCASDLLRRGVPVRVAVIDRKTKRRPDGLVAATPQFASLRSISVTNPPGTLAKEVWDALDQAFKSGERVLVEVIGEEDLLALPAIALAPDGTRVVYGQPDEGAVVVAVDAAVKQRVRAILDRMV